MLWMNRALVASWREFEEQFLSAYAATTGRIVSLGISLVHLIGGINCNPEGAIGLEAISHLEQKVDRPTCGNRRSVKRERRIAKCHTGLGGACIVVSLILHSNSQYGCTLLQSAKRVW